MLDINEEVKCLHCGNIFKKKYKQQTCCNAKCKQRYDSKERYKKLLIKTCPLCRITIISTRSKRCRKCYSKHKYSNLACLKGKKRYIDKKRLLKEIEEC